MRTEHLIIVRNRHGSETGKPAMSRTFIQRCTAYAVLTVNLFAKSFRAMELEELEKDFERLSVSSAQRILWYWRDRIEVQSAVTDSAI
jgi:hypothetical protein